MTFVLFTDVVAVVSGSDLDASLLYLFVTLQKRLKHFNISCLCFLWIFITNIVIIAERPTILNVFNEVWRRGMIKILQLSLPCLQM